MPVQSLQSLTTLQNTVQNNNSAQLDSALLQQLQLRLLALSGVVTEHADYTALRELITWLFQAQQQGNGVVLITDIETHWQVNIVDWQMAYPDLLNDADSHAPITIFPPFVAFRRVFRQLHEVATALQQRHRLFVPSTVALASINWQFNEGGKLSEEQKLAAFSAASLPFCLITGGAGTGKTTTLTKALELILLDDPDSDILLAAPTGKAAQRLNESLSTQLDSVSAEVRESLSHLRAKTLHRLLAISERSGRAFRNAHNPLCCQVLAIDEASMIGSDLLAQILAALPADAKLILLGDANQLPPINAVAFFNDMSNLSPTYTQNFAQAVQCALSQSVPIAAIDDNAPLANHICRLNASKRFAEQSLIEQCAQAVLAGNSQALFAILAQDLQPLTSSSRLYATLAKRYPNNREALLDELPQRMILCANRRGEFGSQSINRYLDDVFRQRLELNNHKNYHEWYEGRQILIEKNYPDLQLSNGDIGRCVRKDDSWQIDFGDERYLSVEWVPDDYSLAFAITIHKSQGSEYVHIDMVLDRFDASQPNALVSAPLLYTAITRAKQSLTIFADDELLQYALENVPKNTPISPLLAQF